MHMCLSTRFYVSTSVAFFLFLSIAYFALRSDYSRIN